MRFNPYAPAFRQNPYPVYAALRAEPPVRSLGMWVLTRHADVVAVLRDRSFSAELIPDLVARHAGATDRILRLGRASLVFTDNPAHARLRALVNRAFTPAAVAELEPLVRRLARSLIGAGPQDLVAEVAGPLPVLVLCEWLGLPAELHPRVAGWTHEVRRLLEPGSLRGDDVARVAAVVEVFAAALSEVRAPGLLRELTLVQTSGGDRLTEEEIALLGVMCFVAGTETSAALIANAVLHAHGVAPSLVPAAVRETLRFDAPLQMTKRISTRDVEIGGAPIAAGDHVLLCLAGANRDPAVFPEPDVFDPTRDPGPHLGFGFGMHGCLGGALAEMQARAVLDEVVAARLAPVGEVRWQTESLIVRAPVALRLTAVVSAR
ncbi:cytochrome P450 [Pseudonocardia sp. WMMC193]|uniref:cytochrome P450 n=1 Tax=Pseudonocardia sp. WMMC193 TaxID=2911965 RepID=UPI001F407EA3|nr:cytochrome P450 [Pseudonocardia sp. WMMC193]MCF7548573.1 cytochrome P450 [Pseudonocardia sp. WMMC193]